MADLYASRGPVRLNDGTADANNAAVLNASPTTEYGLVVRNIPSGTQPVSFAGDIIVVGTDAHDAAVTGDPLTIGGRAQATAPTDVSADADAVRAWFLRNGAQATVLTAAGALIDGDATNGLDVDVTRVTGTVTVDSELNAAAALADAASASVSTASVGSVGLVMNATTLDRQRAVIHAQDTAGTGIAAAGILAEFDDTAPAAVTENQFAPVRMSSRRAQYTEGSIASDLPITANPLTFGGRASTAVPTAVSADGDVVDARFLRTGALTVHMVDAAGAAASMGGGTEYVGDAAATATPTGTMAMGLANAAAPTDVSANNDAVAAWFLRNGSQVVNLAAGGTLIAGGASGLLVDTELPAAAALTADAVASPTAPAVGGFLLGYNGTTWDRVRTANTGRLQVDIVTGGSSAPANELPTGYNMIDLYGSTAGTASGATASVVTDTPANTKQVYIRQAMISASGQTKGQVKFGATVKATFFTSPEKLFEVIRFDPPIPVTGDAVTALTVDVTNREGSAMDLYARLSAIVQA